MINSNFEYLTNKELLDIDGGAISITICGVVFVGWKAVALISAGVTSLGDAIALGIYNGVNSTK